jgi:hypothetical protein
MPVAMFAVFAWPDLAASERGRIGTGRDRCPSASRRPTPPTFGATRSLPVVADNGAVICPGLSARVAAGLIDVTIESKLPRRFVRLAPRPFGIESAL